MRPYGPRIDLCQTYPLRCPARSLEWVGMRRHQHATKQPEAKMTLNIHGLSINCQSHSESLFHSLIRPFKYFCREDDAHDVAILIEETAPPYESFPNLKSVFSTPRNIVYRDEAIKIIDYFGRGVIVEDKSNARYTLYSEDQDLLQEAFYLLVLSLFGQYCDRQGMLRIHALALSYGDTAFLLPLPPGGPSTSSLKRSKNWSATLRA